MKKRDNQEVSRERKDKMLEITGICCSGIKAIEFMEMLPDVIDEDVKTDEFCEKYEQALNRFRYEVAKEIGAKKKIVKAKNKGLHDFKYCGKCGFGADEPSYSYCPNCGTRYRKGNGIMNSIIQLYRDYVNDGGMVSPMNTEPCRKYLQEKSGKYITSEDVLWLFYHTKQKRE